MYVWIVYSHEPYTARHNTVWKIEIRGIEAYFAFFAFSDLIFAHRAFAARAIFARTAADMVLLPLARFGLLVDPGDMTVWAPPFKAAMAP